MRKKQNIKSFVNKKDYAIISYFEWKTSNALIKPLSNIRLHKGDIFIINGNSGIGKSTFMDLLTGNLDENSSFWKIQYSNNSINLKSLEGSKIIKKYIGYCPQNPYLFESTLYENLVLSNSLNENKTKDSIKKIESFLESTGISNRFKNFSINEIMNLALDNFSGGEKKDFLL